jgi:voltage-gated potassium channel
VKLGAGQFFGEVAVLHHKRRAGTATALTRTNLLALSAQDLHALMKRDPRIDARIKDVVEKRTGKKVDPSHADAVDEA